MTARQAGAPAAVIEPAGDGLAVRGDLTFSTVGRLWQDGARQLREAGWPVLQLDGVQHTDSAGLALLVEWARMAADDQARLQLRGVPDQLRAMAMASHVQELIGLSERE